MLCSQVCCCFLSSSLFQDPPPMLNSSSSNASFTVWWSGNLASTIKHIQHADADSWTFKSKLLSCDWWSSLRLLRTITTAFGQTYLALLKHSGSLAAGKYLFYRGGLWPTQCLQPIACKWALQKLHVRWIPHQQNSTTAKDLWAFYYLSREYHKINTLLRQFTLWLLLSKCKKNISSGWVNTVIIMHCIVKVAP